MQKYPRTTRILWARSFEGETLSRAALIKSSVSQPLITSVTSTWLMRSSDATKLDVSWLISSGATGSKLNWLQSTGQVQWVSGSVIC